MQQSNQIIELLNNEKTTFKNISYKSVDRIKLSIINNNSFSNNKFTFNTKSITSQLVLYKDAYILLEVQSCLIFMRTIARKRLVLFY